MGRVHFGRHFGNFEMYFGTPLECDYFDEHDPRTQQVATLDELVSLIRKAWKLRKQNPIWAHVGQQVTIGFHPVETFRANFPTRGQGEIHYRGKTHQKISKAGCHKVDTDEMTILSDDTLIGGIYEDYHGGGPKIYVFADLDKFEDENEVSTGIRALFQRVWDEITGTCGT